MKKIGTALLVADILLCLLLVGYGLCRGHEREQEALSDAAQREQVALSDAAQGEQEALWDAAQGEQEALWDAAQEKYAAREQREGTEEWQQEQVQEQEIRRIAITFDDEGIIGIGVWPEKGHRRVVYSACAFSGLSFGKVGWIILRIVFANVDPFADVFAG